MNGFDGPSTAELAKRLQKRLHLAQPPTYDKRFNRNGVNKDSTFKGANKLKGNKG